ncbi:MAG TPA: class I SAM-dependent methyltransferase [Thermoanaerobaculia bacterium]|nr:class I SAM-dependent methyltransferase [Thermoanaerobaculia bacterium]
MSDRSDVRTAAAFEESWKRVGIVYTREQFLDWFDPLTPDDLRGREVLELGFGNGSLLVHVAACGPARLVGIDLGDTIEHTRRLLEGVAGVDVQLVRGDLTRAELGAFDVVYCIGVIHHLSNPHEGLRAVLRHTRPGGRFHCWVYAREGNGVIRLFVEPLRRIASRAPWWVAKYVFALPLVVPYYLFAKMLRAAGLLGVRSPLRSLPLFDYTRWIAAREFRFFHHVATDQLITPTTHYIPRSTIESWLRDPAVDPESVYVIFRNGNSWKFGGRRRA